MDGPIFVLIRVAETSRFVWVERKHNPKKPIPSPKEEPKK